MLHHCFLHRAFVVSAIAIILEMAVSCSLGWAGSEKFALTRDGKPAATIVAAAPAMPLAKELQYHVQKITGAMLPIKSDKEKVEGSRILVGPSAATAPFGLNADQFGDQEYVIRFSGNTLILLGGKQGTSYAVYDFLERFCDVRWYGPGESQMVTPRTATLAVQPHDVRRSPAFAWRAVYAVYEASRNMILGSELYGHPTPQDMNQFWTRLRLGGEPYVCNHAFEGYYDRFWKKNTRCPEAFVAAHPDWFGQNYPANELKGNGGRPLQMCYSNQGLIDQVVADARRYFDGQGRYPGTVARGNYFALAPMDGNGWCRCAACQKQIDEAQRKKTQLCDIGSASDYWFTFVNKVAREIAKSHPGKYISTLAYSDYAYYPQKVRLEPNVSVQMCLHTRNWWSPGVKENDLRVYRGWLEHEKGRPLYLWLYYCFPELTLGPQYNCFPGFSSHTLGPAIKMFARDGARGVFIEGVSDQVDTYVTMRLLDDPSLDIDALLEEFFTRYYGAAAEPMKRFYLRVEEIYSNPANYPVEVQKNLNKHFLQTEEMAWKYLGTETRMAELGTIMDEATRSAVTPVEKQRVALFRKAVWDYMVEGRKQYLAKQQGKKP